MSDRHSELYFSEARVDLRASQDPVGDVLYTCPDGIPVLWLFCFGARNVWNPGDQVEDRGGAVGRKNPYETQIEVALARLEHAEGTMREALWLWPWFSAMPILQRKLVTKPRTGFVRLRAPWLIGLSDEQMSIWRSTTAIVENCVNFVAQGRLDDAARSLATMREFAPFVGVGDHGDAKQFAKAKLYKGEEEALRLALLTLGEPEKRNLLESAATREIVPALAKLKTLGAAPKRLTAAAATGGGGRGGLLGRLKSMMGRK